VRARGAHRGIVTVAAFPGARTVNTAARSSTADNPKVRISGRVGSVLYGVGNDSGRPARRAMPSGQGLLTEFHTDSSQSMWVQRAVRPMLRRATVTLGASDPKNNAWNMAAVEVRGLPPKAKVAAAAPKAVAPVAPVAPAAPAPAPAVPDQPPAPAAPAQPPAAVPDQPPAPATAAPDQPPAAVPDQPRAPALAARAGGVPEAGNTGVPADTSLTASGPRIVTIAGEVLDSLDISGGVVIEAPNVVITRSRIRGDDMHGVYVKSGSVSISDTEIIGFGNGIAFKNWSCVRCNIHGQSQDGVKLGSSVRLEASYIHGLTPEPGAHADGAQMQGAESNVHVIGNSIDSSNGDSSGNAAIILKPDFGGSGAGPIVIEGNVLGGGNYTLFHVAIPGIPQHGVRITGNRFKRNSIYGPAHITAPLTESGNVWEDSGAPLSL